MTIEFQTLHTAVKEWVVNYVKEKLLALHKTNKSVSRARVCFRQQHNEKICEIDLTVLGASLFVHRKASSFEQATKEALKEILEKAAQQAIRKNEIPVIIPTP